MSAGLFSRARVAARIQYSIDNAASYHLLDLWFQRTHYGLQSSESHNDHSWYPTATKGSCIVLFTFFSVLNKERIFLISSVYNNNNNNNGYF